MRRLAHGYLLGGILERAGTAEFGTSTETALLTSLWMCDRIGLASGWMGLYASLLGNEKEAWRAIELVMTGARDHKIQAGMCARMQHDENG